jgi:hypothetical protein
VYLPSVNQRESSMMYAVITLLLLAVVAEAQLPSRQSRHHDALTGRVQHIPDLFVKGHRDNFVIKPQLQHHDALTGSVQQIPDLFVKGHVRDNFVLKPWESQHHDALTGGAPRIPGLFIKGHAAEPTSSYDEYSLRKPMVVDTTVPSIQELTFCKVSGDECSQYTLEKQWMALATTFGGFQKGTCWEHGYNANGGSKEINMPLIGKTNVRFFTASKQGIARTEELTQTSSDIIRALAVALISLVGVGGAVFAMLRVRRGTFMADEESLLASSKA